MDFFKSFEIIDVYKSREVDDISDRLIYNHVWIDEKYIEDYQVLESNNEKHPRGLSKTKICIVVAIDSNKNMAKEIVEL